MRFEQRSVIRMSRCALPVNGGVEHAADIGARDGAAMHTHADKTTRELVHDHKYPVAPEHDRLASKEVHAPEAVGGVADERQPRRPGSARSRAIVFRQHAVDDVLVDVDPECLRDDVRNPWAAEPRIGDLSSTMAWMSALLDPFGPGCLGRGVAENSRRYLQRTTA